MCSNLTAKMIKWLLESFVIYGLSAYTMSYNVPWCTMLLRRMFNTVAQGQASSPFLNPPTKGSKCALSGMTMSWYSTSWIPASDVGIPTNLDSVPTKRSTKKLLVIQCNSARSWKESSHRGWSCKVSYSVLHQLEFMNLWDCHAACQTKIFQNSLVRNVLHPPWVHTSEWENCGLPSRTLPRYTGNCAVIPYHCLQQRWPSWSTAEMFQNIPKHSKTFQNHTSSK